MYYRIQKDVSKNYSGTGPIVFVTLVPTPYTKGPVPQSEARAWGVHFIYKSLQTCSYFSFYLEVQRNSMQILFCLRDLSLHSSYLFQQYHHSRLYRREAEDSHKVRHSLLCKLFSIQDLHFNVNARLYSFSNNIYLCLDANLTRHKKTILGVLR